MLKGTSGTLVYSIPISYTTSLDFNFNDTSPKIWLHQREKEFDTVFEDDEWLIFNIKSTGKVNNKETLDKNTSTTLVDVKSRNHVSQ